MSFLKTSVLNGISVAIRTGISFLLNKILAVYIGPAGYPLIGQFQNFIQMVTTFSGSAINTAVVKYTAEYHQDTQKQQKIWKNAGSVVFILSFICSVGIILFKEQLAISIFGSTEYENVFIWFGCFLLFFNLNAMFIAILNGKKEIIKLVVANIVGSLFSLVITSFLAINHGIYGALIAVSIYQSLVFIVTLFICYKSPWFKISYLFGELDRKILKKFNSYILMALVSAICVPLSQMLIRRYLVNTFGDTQTGYWEAMTRLSSAYLMFITTTLSVYYLPRLSELTLKKDLKSEIYLGYRYILPITIIIGLVAFLLRDWIIQLLFTGDFSPMRDLFAWQFLGDTLKIGSWLIAYLMLSKAMTKFFVITEIIFTILWVILVYIYCYYFGLKGSVIAYAINYFLYWIVTSILIFNRIKE
ncbi:O-antigen translocase [Capnocytophaga cynodegmi]|uniref:O-antigen translocase n=1 Tax=Capnocytophaga cynodegmi TaxID=28189 RepID=UPI00385BF614